MAASQGSIDRRGEKPNVVGTPHHRMLFSFKKTRGPVTHDNGARPENTMCRKGHQRRTGIVRLHACELPTASSQTKKVEQRLPRAGGGAVIIPLVWFYLG